jgi:hypothetical protein
MRNTNNLHAFFSMVLSVIHDIFVAFIKQNVQAIHVSTPKIIVIYCKFFADFARKLSFVEMFLSRLIIS